MEKLSILCVWMLLLSNFALAVPSANDPFIDRSEGIENFNPPSAEASFIDKSNLVATPIESSSNIVSTVEVVPVVDLPLATEELSIQKTQSFPTALIAWTVLVIILFGLVIFVVIKYTKSHQNKVN
jgi:hypothetical protein